MSMNLLPRSEEKNPNAVITADELGCGIVRQTRKRGMAGRRPEEAAEILAADSDAVYRMICGIAVRLK